MRATLWRRSIPVRRGQADGAALNCAFAGPLAALRFGIEVVTPRTLRSENAAATLREFNPDVVVVAAYGLILPKTILDVPAKGCLNLHASLLPRWRGAAPIERAIMAGDLETGAIIMRVEEGLDTGPVALKERIAIGPDANAGEIRAKLASAGADLMTRALAMLEQGGLVFTPQADEGVTYAHKIEKSEARIDWTNRHRTSTIWFAVWRRFRVLFSRPGLAREWSA